MGRDIPSVIIEHLDFFQSFDDVKVYYGNGQDIVKQALDRSVGKVFSKGAVRRRKASMTDYRLEQVADYLCTIELALVKYEAKENGGRTTSSSAASVLSRETGSSRPAASRYNWVPQLRKERSALLRLGAQVTRFEQREPKRKQRVSWAPIANVAPQTAVGTDSIKPCLPYGIILLHRTYVLFPLDPFGSIVPSFQLRTVSAASRSGSRRMMRCRVLSAFGTKAGIASDTFSNSGR